MKHSIQSHQRGEVATWVHRPKLLFLAWYFPPLVAVPCVRTWSISKYLARLGWDVTVVTPDPHLWLRAQNREETENNLRFEKIQRILTDHGQRHLISELIKCDNTGPVATVVEKLYRRTASLLDIDNCIGWIRAAETACAILSSRDVDVILATGSPFSSFTLAKHLSVTLRRPYVLDYRDPWTGNPHSDRSPRGSTVKQEANLLDGSSSVTVVSPSWASLLDQRFALGEKLNIITNGYDPEDFSCIEPIKFDHRAIVYTGTFYVPKRVITPIMAALKHLIESRTDKGNEWYFHYYGPDQNHVCEEAKRYDVMDRVVLHGSVPRKLALSAVRGATVALVITSVDAQSTLADRGIVTGKVFEALGLGTPILLIAPDGNDAAAIVEGTGMGRRITGTDIQEIAHFLMTRAMETTKPKQSAASYSWPILARKLDLILRKVIERDNSELPQWSDADLEHTLAVSERNEDADHVKGL